MDELSASILRVQKIQECFVGPLGGSRLFWNTSNFIIWQCHIPEDLNLWPRCENLSLFPSLIMHLISLLGLFQQKFQWAFSCVTMKDVKLKRFITTITPYHFPFQPSSQLPFFKSVFVFFCHMFLCLSHSHHPRASPPLLCVYFLFHLYKLHIQTILKA
jgi:hypothetical protein